MSSGTVTGKLLRRTESSHLSSAEYGERACKHRRPRMADGKRRSENTWLLLCFRAHACAPSACNPQPAQDPHSGFQIIALLHASSRDWVEDYGTS